MQPSSVVVTLIEPVCRGSEHAPFNAAFTLAVLEAAHQLSSHSRPALNFFGDDDHIQELSATLGNPLYRDRIAWTGVPIPSKATSFFRRMVREVVLLRYLLRKHSSLGTPVFLMCADKSTILAAKIARYLSCPEQKMCIVMHGRLAELSNEWRPRNPLNRLDTLRFALSFGTNKNIHYITLETSIEENLLRILPFLSGHTFTVPHPIPLDEQPDRPLTFSPPFNIAFLGATREEKGFGAFLNMAKAAYDEQRPFRFHVIGRQVDGYSRDNDLYFTTPPFASALDRKLFSRLLSQMHYVCLPYNPSHYSLSASGALLDAIANLKPIIALRNQTLDDLCKCYGSIGYLCCTPEDLPDVLREIGSSISGDEYMQQMENIEKIRRARSPVALSSRIGELVRT